MLLFLIAVVCSGCVGAKPVVLSEAQLKAEHERWRTGVRAWGQQYKDAITKYQSATSEADITTVIDQLLIVVATAPTERARRKAAGDLCVVAAGLGDVALLEHECFTHGPLNNLLR
jgi:hypothetical protein